MKVKRVKVRQNAPIGGKRLGYTLYELSLLEVKKSMPAATPAPQQKVLDSWKEIAVFLRRGVRTVQRWERDEGLPIVRHHHLKRGSVRAFPAQLEKWQQQRERIVFRPPDQLSPIDKMRSLIFEQGVLMAELKRAQAQNYAQWMLRPTSPSSRGQASVISLVMH